MIHMLMLPLDANFFPLLSYNGIVYVNVPICSA